MAGHLCLKWNNHSSAFLKSITTIHAKEKYCDATIVCQGKYFPVHRMVLSTCSDYFDEMFERMQCQHPYIVFKDIDPKEMELLLNYMYQGEVNVIQESLPTLIKAAEALRIKGLAVPDDLPSKESSGRKRSSTSTESSLSKRRAEERRKRRDSSQDFPDSESYSQHSINKNNLLNESSDILEQKNIKEEPLDVCDYADNSIANVSRSSSLQNENQKDESLSFLDFPVTNIKTEEGVSSHPETSELYEGQSSSWDDFSTSNMEDIPPPPDIGGQDDNPDTNVGALPMAMSEPLQEPFSAPVVGHVKPAVYHQCAFCSFKSYNKTVVVRHTKFKHTGERPHGCKLCHSRFVSASDLHRHFLTHTGEKPFICRLCGQKFRHSNTRKYHERKCTKLTSD